jgi:4-hydroxy-tetrahydrodipicolinate reductase
MKIALDIRKMGQVIERIAQERRSRLFEEDNTGLYLLMLQIDFNVPTAAVPNISNCFLANVPVVSGTTGWLEHYDEMVALCSAKNGAFISSSNFSLGNIFFEINSILLK